MNCMPPGERLLNNIKMPDPFESPDIDEHDEGEMIVLDLSHEDVDAMEALYKEHRQLEEDYKALDEVQKALLSNLTSVQARCTELELARREATRMSREAVDESIAHMRRYLETLARAEKAELELRLIRGRAFPDVRR